MKHKRQVCANPNVSQQLDQTCSPDQPYYSSVVYSASNIGFNSGLCTDNNAGSSAELIPTSVASKQDACYSEADSQDIHLGGQVNPGALCVVLESTEVSDQMYIDVI